MIYILKTIRKGIPSIFLTPFSEPIPRSTDKEIMPLPTILILLHSFNICSAYSFLMDFSP